MTLVYRGSVTTLIEGPTPATLTGLAVGDSLGMPFETLKCGDPKIEAWDGVTYKSSDYHKLGPGGWTDDTAMALAITESLLEYHDFNPSDIANRYVQWQKSPDFRGAGKNTKKALERLSQGCSWVNSGILKAEGNGPAMRIAPLGLFFYRQPLKVIAELAAQEAGITHDSDAGRQGAVAVALGVALLARGEATPQTVTQRVIDALEPGLMKERLKQAAARVAIHAEKPWEVISEMGAKAHILETVPAAFYALGKCNDYRTTVEISIRAGGDTDTTAAIAGALAGTYYGVSQVEPFLSELHQGDRIRALECRLFTEGLKVTL